MSEMDDQIKQLYDDIKKAEPAAPQAAPKAGAQVIEPGSVSSATYRAMAASEFAYRQRCVELEQQLAALPSQDSLREHAALKLLVSELNWYASKYGLGPARLQYALAQGEAALASPAAVPEAPRVDGLQESIDDVNETTAPYGGLSRAAAASRDKELRALIEKWRSVKTHDEAIDGGWGSHGTVGLAESKCADELEAALKREGRGK